MLITTQPKIWLITKARSINSFKDFNKCDSEYLRSNCLADISDVAVKGLYTHYLYLFACAILLCFLSYACYDLAVFRYLLVGRQALE